MGINRSKKNKRVGLKIFVLSLLILIIIIILTMCSTDIWNKSNIEKGGIQLPNKVDAQNIVDKAVKKGMFKVFINTTINIDEDDNARLLIENSIDNMYSTYVEIIDVKTKKEIYKSDIIEPGYKIETDKIKIDTGKYEGMATFYIIDEKEKSISNIEIPVTINKN